MITIKNETIAQVPSLHVVKDTLRNEQSTPTIFFFHGFTSAKENNLHVAYLLAQKGFRVFLPDALYHGEREIEQHSENRDLAFWEIILTSIQELDAMRSELKEKGLLCEDKLGVIGTSMGAITMFGALTQYPWIKTAVSFMGTAYYETFAYGLLETAQRRGLLVEESLQEDMLKKIKPFDLSKQLDKLDGRPLFMWHGKADEVVPYPLSEQFYNELTTTYKQTPDNLQFMAEEKVGHKVSRTAVLKSIDWFEQHLKTKVSS
ncbi:esterase [Halalkalibacter wakoensis]|nr:esterase [Halalkalibacter wakoensis]